MPEYIVQESNRPVFTAARLIWTAAWIVEILLGFRFLLRMLGANPSAGFTDFIYRTSRPFIDPFIGTVKSTSLNGGGLFETSTMIAMIVYFLLAWAIIRLITFTSPTYKETV